MIFNGFDGILMFYCEFISTCFFSVANMIHTFMMHLFIFQSLDLKIVVAEWSPTQHIVLDLYHCVSRGELFHQGTDWKLANK